MIALKRQGTKLRDHVFEHADKLAVSDVTLFEMLAGASAYPDPARRFQAIDRIMARISVAPFDAPAAHHAADIRFSLKSGMIGIYDVLIEAIARSPALVLVTSNTREFKRVDGLRTENWLR